MGFIKAIATATSGQLSDTYREVIKYNNNDKKILIKKVTTENGIIQNESRLFVEPGQCAVYTDNGAIKDIITEPGMYFMDTSSPSLFQVNIFKGIGQTFLETAKRIAYEGEEITSQAVYFVSLAEIPNIGFNNSNKILYKDPEWGALEIRLDGTYGIKVSNPINLLTNVNSNSDSCDYMILKDAVDKYVSSLLMQEVNKLTETFDKIPSKVNDLTKDIITKINVELDSLGVEITRLVVSEVIVPEEIRKAMYERTGIKMKATSVSDKEADIYTKLNTAEAIKDLANNSNNSGTQVMGMNLGNTFSGMINNNNNNENNK